TTVPPTRLSNSELGSPRWSCPLRCGCTGCPSMPVGWIRSRLSSARCSAMSSRLMTFPVHSPWSEICKPILLSCMNIPNLSIGPTPKRNCSPNAECHHHRNSLRNYGARYLELLLTRPETPERAVQELQLHLILGPALVSAQGWAAPAVEQHYLRARALCDQLGDIPQRVPVLYGLWGFHVTRGELRTAQALAEECLQLAGQTHEAGLLPQAHFAVGLILLGRGELVHARMTLEQGVAYYQPQHRARVLLSGGLSSRT